MFRGGPEHAGVYGGEDAHGFSGVRWASRLGGAVRSSPTVVDGVAYVGSTDGILHALSLADGSELWAYDAGSPISSTPAVAGSLVFVGDRAGTLHAVRAEDGVGAWRLETGPDMPLPWGNEGWDYYTSSPVVAQGIVVIGSGDGSVYAADAATGELRWSYATEGRIRSSPAVANGVVYVGSMDGRLHAIDLATGAAKWRFETEGYALDSSEWGFDRRSIQSSPAVVGGTVYFGSRDGHVYAVDAATGAARWRFDQEVSWCITSPAVRDGVVYAGTSDGHFVQALDAASGEELWRTPTGGRVFASPSVAGETVVVGDQAGTLFALDAATGAVRWRYDAGDAIQSSATVGGDLILVGSDDGYLYALQGTSGKGLRRGVFWDASLFSLYDGSEELRDDLAGAGYDVLDTDGLLGFMKRQVREGGRSVVVFAVDRVPANVGAVAADTVLFRRYMDSGGRVVWLGYPPFSVLVDAKTGRPTDVNPALTTAVLGVSHDGATLDEYPSWPTKDGRAWGMHTWFIDRLGVPPEDVSLVLARDERGRATSWVRRYGEEGAFVRLWGRRDPMPDLRLVRRFAEQELPGGR
ncbi:MAG TPA: PQQ-binding-like beta-propeller repeat protein [Longimicrobiales bacterium]|nr:PQQ-binding-like beta-propeller repeat protein [Longimicrobiales bacterium]